MSEWISVKERLPEDDVEVLVYWRNHSKEKSYYQLTHHAGDHWFALTQIDRPWIEVLAWMPLPEPPEEG